MKCGIYKIINKINNKYYIGSSINLSHRWWKHINNLNKKSHCNIHLQNAWNKYGKDNFEFVIIKEMDDKINKDGLIKEEQLWLDIAKKELEKTYNLCFIAGGGDTITNHPNKNIIIKNLQKITSGNNNPMFGKTHSKETKEKWSILRKGRFSGKDHPNYGKHLSDNVKRKISISHCKKNWKFVSPSGEIKEIKNLKLFCNENNLNNGAMGNVFKGKSNHHKGWKRVIENT